MVNDERTRKPLHDSANTAAGTPAAGQDVPLLSECERQLLKEKLRKEIEALSDEECAIIVSIF